jgi:hypothetical protein
MKASGVPIGKSEDQRLEFKGRDALRDKDRLSIAREVVAMLNADGGEIWIGVAEQGGRAVQVEPIPDAESEKRGLQDHLIDVIEPPLTHEEVQLEAVGKVLWIRVTPRPKRGPYGLRGKGGATYFPVRIGDRLRPMTRDEQRAAFAGEPEEKDRLGQAMQEMLAERAKLQSRGDEWLSLRILPVPEISLEGRGDELRQMLQEPELTGNRPNGWSFANRYVQPETHGKGRITSRWPPSHFESDQWWSMEIRPCGAIHYAAGLAHFSYHAARGQQRPKDGSPELWPLAISELPVSVMRLAARIYEGHLGKDGKVLADLCLFGLRGWKLRPGSPRFLGHRVLWDFPEAAIFEGQDLVLPEPLVFEWQEVKETPDRCGYRLVAQIYREFGYGPEAISIDVFDPKTGRLLLES